MAKAKQTPKLIKARKLNEKLKSAAETIQWNLANPGRPSKYHEGFCHIAEQCCIINADSPQLAEMFGTHTSTVLEWQQQHKAFSSAIIRGKAKTDEEVERALVHAAKGYSHPDTVFMAEQIGNGRSVIRHIPITKHYAPDTRAAQFWLKNRKPKDYRPDPLLKPVGDVPEDAAAALRAQLAAMKDLTEGKED